MNHILIAWLDYNRFVAIDILHLEPDEFIGFYSIITKPKKAIAPMGEERMTGQEMMIYIEDYGIVEFVNYYYLIIRDKSYWQQEWIINCHSPQYIEPRSSRISRRLWLCTFDWIGHIDLQLCLFNKLVEFN